MIQQQRVCRVTKARGTRSYEPCTEDQPPLTIDG